MELYTTKKLTSVEEFGLAPSDTLPCMHVVTPEVIVKIDANDNMYIAECPSDPLCIANLIKIKKHLCKQAFASSDDKTKIMDEILWVKPSPCMMYKKGKSQVPINRMIVNRPVRLQLSCKESYMYTMPKPYNVHNMFWSIDYVIVDETFDWNTLQGGAVQQ